HRRRYRPSPAAKTGEESTDWQSGKQAHDFCFKLSCRLQAKMLSMNTVYRLDRAACNEANPPEGTRRLIDGQERVLYDGYWIKTYPVPADSLDAKKRLIEALTRRLFNHTEHGLNIPGTRLAEARQTYEAESDPGRRRVKAAMLAGTLFNRATDIFRKLEIGR